MRVMFKGGPADGKSSDVADGTLALRLPFIENPQDQIAREIDDYADPEKWEWVFGELRRKDRPRFGAVLYQRTEERDGDAIIFRP